MMASLDRALAMAGAMRLEVGSPAPRWWSEVPQGALEGLWGALLEDGPEDLLLAVAHELDFRAGAGAGATCW